MTSLFEIEISEAKTEQVLLDEFMLAVLCFKKQKLNVETPGAIQMGVK